eukprot:CAMPEP_0173441416 /NCGR_PEP_ID=MMETSP1357-20121228/23949_1 /TAXON_ID=77926 /ORGANISM="Hemiselmis rufescens, Strain PCC563" /LENGTH=60 /DNA_ID=CAMNT_0014406995 /DNA_START=38 /DNA_END=220 /DNA_ORIENTATION=-
MFQLLMGADVDGQYCRSRFSDYDKTAEPDLLNSYYSYWCDHYTKGTQYPGYPAEEHAPME